MADPTKVDTTKARTKEEIKAMLRKTPGREDLDTIRPASRPPSDRPTRSVPPAAQIPLFGIGGGKRPTTPGSRRSKRSSSSRSTASSRSRPPPSSASSSSRSRSSLRRRAKRQPFTNAPAASAWKRSASSSSSGEEDHKPAFATSARATLALNARIETAAKRATLAKVAQGDESDDDVSALVGGGSLPHRAVREIKRSKRIKMAGKRMSELVDDGRLPWKALLDNDFAQDVEANIDEYDHQTLPLAEDPDAWDTDELLSDAEPIDSTDSETDTPRRVKRRKRLREKRYYAKLKALRRRRVKAKRQRMQDLQRSKHRYYDELIMQIQRENPHLGANAPPATADLEVKRSFVDRGTTETIVRQKSEQMKMYILLASIAVEFLSILIGFPKLNGFTDRMKLVLSDPRSDPMIAQLARKYLRRGSPSPEMSLFLMFSVGAGTIHITNARNDASTDASTKTTEEDEKKSDMFKVLSKGIGLLSPVMGFFTGGLPAAFANPQPARPKSDVRVTEEAGAGAGDAGDVGGDPNAAPWDFKDDEEEA